MISVQVNIDRQQIEDSIVDTLGFADHDDLLDLIVSVMERVGSPVAVKDLIGMLGYTYAYLEETFGE